MGLFSKNKKPKSKARKIIEWILTGLFAVIFVFFGVMTIVGQVTKKDNFNVPRYGDYQVLEVLTDSMSPKYKVKSAVFVKKIKYEKFAVGDDITFMWRINSSVGEMPMTHQLLEIQTPEETGTGHYRFVAHGINKNSKQCNGDCTGQTQVFDETKVLGKVVGHSIVIGAVFNFMTKPIGLLLLLLIPALYLIATSVIDIVMAVKDDEDDKVVIEGATSEVKEDDPLKGLSKEDIARLKEEMLNEMIEEKQKEKEVNKDEKK